MSETIIPPRAENPTELRSGRSDQPPADYIAETKQLYSSLGYDSYRWAERSDAIPLAPLAKPLADSTVMLIGSGGIYRRGQVAFHSKDDTSVRAIPSSVNTSELRTAHFAYDQTDARTDINCVFPLDRLAELAGNDIIGGVAAAAISFMGGIYSTRRLETETVPAILQHVEEQAPDVVLLVPV